MAFAGNVDELALLQTIRLKGQVTADVLARSWASHSHPRRRHVTPSWHRARRRRPVTARSR